MEGIIHYELLERDLTVTAEPIVNNFAVWRKQSSKYAQVNDMERFFSITALTTHCKHDESGLS
jgi:hypothetical protein